MGKAPHSGRHHRRPTRVDGPAGRVHSRGRPARHRLDFAVYEPLVGQRLRHATANTPFEIIETLLAGLPVEGVGPAPDTETTINRATRPLADTGWTIAIDGLRRTRRHWRAPGGKGDAEFDALAAET